VSGIHQFVPVLHRGDAVGRHTLALRDAVLARGLESRIYVGTLEPETQDETTPVLDYPAQANGGDVVLYQFATASPMAAWLAGRRETLVVNYHNITPPGLLAPWDNHLALGQLRAQSELTLLVPRAALAIADSDYNRQHLVTAGFAQTAVVPPSASLPQETLTAGAARSGRTPGDGGARWLCVGRIAPNKALEDVVAALMVTRAHADPAATLSIIGKPATASDVTALHRYVASLGLCDAVTFGGHASDAAVVAAYARSDVLVVTSEHEGYCVPVVEAMMAGLPVVAFRQGALPDVLGPAGILIDAKDPFTLSATIGRVVADGPGRTRLAQLSAERLSQLDLTTAADRFVGLLCDVGERPR
jgi:glycosyltransferase involved in cell wall biosynthesis